MQSSTDGNVASIDGNVTSLAAARTEASAIRHRGAERFTLMLRVAKLVSSHGEYPCVVRDVSATGLRVRLFHALPPERHMALMLGNGECYFVESVWEQGREAGLQFSAPIDVAAFMTESSPHPKRQVRLAIDLPATLSIRDFASPVLIRDLSQHGAKLESEQPLALSQHCRLKAHHLPELFASVRWSKGSTYGLVFQRSFRLDELATLIWTLRAPAERLAAIRLREAAAAALAPAASLRAG
jgi:hypothetical protein